MKIVARARLLFVLALVSFVHFHGTALALEAAQTREAFLKMIDRPRVDPKVEVGDAVEADGLKISHFSYDSEANERVPGIAVYPADTATKLPCIIVMHGTGGSKDGQVGLLKKLALKGCIAVAIDARYHGERAKPLPGLKNTTRLSSPVSWANPRATRFIGTRFTTSCACSIFSVRATMSTPAVSA